MEPRKRILSGMRPTGPLHIGHLVGALNNWKKLQDEYECYFMIADWHALMSEYANPGEIEANTLNMMLDWVSCGLDPERSTLFVQSHIPEHLELDMIFALLVPLGWLERNPTYKEQLREIKGRDLTTYAFLGYPVLQAADIAMYKANAVPVGADQLPHLELTREIVRRFNGMYGKDVFPEPEALLTETPKLLGSDNRKMSKSYDNYIALGDDPSVIRKKVQTMVTDPARIKLSDKGHPEKCNVFSYYKIFASDGQAREVRHWCTNALKGCTECKKIFAEVLITSLEPIRNKREWYLKDAAGKDKLIEIIRNGQAAASTAAARTMKEVKKDMLHMLTRDS